MTPSGEREDAEEFAEAPRGDSTFPDPIPGEGDPVATGPNGSGEWPDRDAPATGPSPGATGHPRAAEAQAERQANVSVDDAAKDRLDGADDSTAATGAVSRDD